MRARLGRQSTPPAFCGKTRRYCKQAAGNKVLRRRSQRNHHGFRSRRVAAIGSMRNRDKNVRFRKVRGGATPRNVVRGRGKARRSALLALEMTRDVEPLALLPAVLFHIVAIKKNHAAATRHSTITIIEPIDRSIE